MGPDILSRRGGQEPKGASQPGQKVFSRKKKSETKRAFSKARTWNCGADPTKRRG